MNDLELTRVKAHIKGRVKSLQSLSADLARYVDKVSVPEGLDPMGSAVGLSMYVVTLAERIETDVKAMKMALVDIMSFEEARKQQEIEAEFGPKLPGMGADTE